MSMYRQRPPHSTRPSLGRRLGILLLVLLCLAGLASAVFLCFFRGYVVNTPEGPRLQLPFSLQAPTESGNKESGESSAVFGSGQTVTLPEQNEESTLLSPLHAVLLPEDSILAGTAEERMNASAANAVIVDMRTEDGSLQYVSKLKTAIDSGASAASPGLNEAIQTMNRNPHIYSIARVSCFSDAHLAKLRPELCLKRASGAPWRDSENMTWLSPSKDEVQRYLTDICRELSDLGFDEILLTHCAYPTQGARAQQAEGCDSVETLSLTLQDFYQEMRRVAKEKGLVLSLLWEDSPQNEQKKPLSGQSLEEILPLADRVFLRETDENFAQVFSARGLSYANLSLIPILSKPGGASNSWAILSPSD